MTEPRLRSRLEVEHNVWESPFRTPTKCLHTQRSISYTHRVLDWLVKVCREKSKTGGLYPKSSSASSLFSQKSHSFAHIHKYEVIEFFQNKADAEKTIRLARDNDNESALPKRHTATIVTMTSTQIFILNMQICKCHLFND